MNGASDNDDLANKTVATTADARHQINSINPYATKKKAPDLYRKPLEEFDDNFDDEPMSKNAVDVDDSEKEDGETAIQKQAAATLDNKNSNAEEKTDSTTAMQPLTARTAMSVQLPMWKRLPTHTVGISPAEILTISEVCRHGCLYDNQSVRLTGLLTHRWASTKSTGEGEAVEVSLVLEDPLAKLSSDAHISSRAVAVTASRSRPNQFSTTKKHQRASSTLKSRRISFGRTQTTTIAATPMLSSRGGEAAAALGESSVSAPATGVPTPKQAPTSKTAALAPTTPARKRTGLMSTTSNALMSSSKFRTPSLSSRNRKRGLSSISRTPMPQKTIQETMASVLSNPQKAVVWIVVDARHVSVDALTIGDIVTVVGTVQRYQHHADMHSSPDGNDANDAKSESSKTNGSGGLLGTENSRTNSHIATEDEEPAGRTIRRSAATCEIGDLILREQQQRQNTQQNIDPSTSPLAVKSDNDNGALFLEARILRKDNGANLQLHEQALKLRRRHILATYHSHRLIGATEATAGTMNVVDDTILLGCGPPPYTLST